MFAPNGRIAIIKENSEGDADIRHLLIDCIPDLTSAEVYGDEIEFEFTLAELAVLQMRYNMDVLAERQIERYLNAMLKAEDIPMELHSGKTNNSPTLFQFKVRHLETT